MEQTAPASGPIVAPGAVVEWLGSGFGGFTSEGWIRGTAEGPVWIPEDDCLIFSDNADDKRYRWSEADGIALVNDHTNDANGLARDLVGRIIACEHKTRRVTREEHDGSITVVADRYHGARLNRPNDVVVRSDGSIYFTDPITLGVDSDLDFAGVYRVDADLGRVHLLVRDFALPNGLAFSPDEAVLYVNDSQRRHIRAFDLERGYDTGRLNLGSDRVLCDMRDAPGIGGPDGMKIDSLGNVWCTGPGGIWVVDPNGARLGVVDCGDKHATNLCFGGPDLTTLFITTLHELGRIEVTVPGLRLPPTPS